MATTQNNPWALKYTESHNIYLHPCHPQSSDYQLPPFACSYFEKNASFSFQSLYDIVHGCHKLTLHLNITNSWMEHKRDRLEKNDYCNDNRPTQSICIQGWKDIYFCVYLKMNAEKRGKDTDGCGNMKAMICVSSVIRDHLVWRKISVATVK